ncbi:Flp pilus assembly complex ATPase component TadA [bacterium]|jgi:twitching motility protein PilT|nr:Flp pilus assembly complex ATPase component TadA [bacterium]MBT4122123.1 Flp pilus assembly complex ATPase component TadA [bacterium]MBT4335197.1 Flp pilus assembly complex ATPase component TadA [bacterium]MBT4495983.1 Flp pilus assembly complex ATPase component TadA [bacterium]MBT4763499.1 Flp pilus assembly complex ATPase component TadA [bacterium]
MTTTVETTINQILNSVAERRATDIHFDIGSNPFIRVNGKLVSLPDVAVVNKEFLDALIKYFVPAEQLELLKKRKEIKFVFPWKDKARFKVHIFKQKGSHSVSLKLITGQILSLEKLGVPKVISSFSRASSGLIIVTGAFNSGRSTTLAAIIDEINKSRKERILLLEKPIEHLFINDQSFIEQREIGNDVNSFTEGLVSISDQDINVVVLSEVDNLKTLEALLEMAESGRLVLVIMNYDTVISCIQGIVSDFPEAKKKWVRDVLAKYLVGIIAQKLIPDVKGDQALAVEILTSSDSGKSLIKDGRFANLESIIQTSRAQGMISMDMSLAELVRMGRIDQQEAAKYATDPKTIAKLFR